MNQVEFARAQLRFEQLEENIKENFSKFLDKATFRKFNAENHRDIANLKIKIAQIPHQKYSKKQRHWFDNNKNHKKESDFDLTKDLPNRDDLPKIEEDLRKNSDYKFTKENTKTPKDLKTPRMSNLGELSEFQTESEFDFDKITSQNLELSSFVKLSEILSKVLIRRDELIKLFEVLSSQEEEFKKLHGVNKAPHLMNISERQKYKEFVKLQNIKEEITELVNKKGSKISPLGSPKVQKLITSKKSFKIQRYRNTIICRDEKKME